VIVSVAESGAANTSHLPPSYVEQITERVQEDLKARGTPEARTAYVVLSGRPELELLEYASENNVSLIAMASHGKSGQTQWLLGNIAAKILRASRQPVLLIREAAPAQVIEQKKIIRRILVPLDGSEIGEAAIPLVKPLARDLGAELVLFQAVAPIRVSAAQFEDSWADIVQQDEEARRDAIAVYLEEIGKSLREDGLNVSIAIGSGSPADQIIDYADSSAIDLIGMSTHGRSGIGRWVLGSVTDKVLHAGNTPVLVVRATP
jgi:nucleotide-binding universal stress UspA family protein